MQTCIFDNCYRHIYTMATGFLRVKDDTIVDGNGKGVVMRGAALGGWMKYVDD